MQISLNWLRQFVNTDWSAAQISDLLTDLGLEVEGIHSYESIPGMLDGMVVGEVLTCEKHPNADKLKVTSVDVGEDEPLPIVCGAPNVDKGQKVVVATVGSTIYPIVGEPFKIKKAKIRDHVSMGMICAEDEIGIGQSHDGIIVLDNKWKPGTPCQEVFSPESDQVFEIGLTPNRADAMSHMGVARDLKAGWLQQGIQTKLITPSVNDFHIHQSLKPIRVDVLDAKAYLHMKKRGVRVGQTVNQGDYIGTVGMTGYTSGPHVCYRFWKNGKQVDPFKTKLPDAKPIASELKAAYLQHMIPWKDKLDCIYFEEQKTNTNAITNNQSNENSSLEQTSETL